MAQNTPPGGPKYPEVAQNTPKWPKIPQSGPKYPEVAQNTPKWPKIPQSGPKYPEVAQNPVWLCTLGSQPHSWV